MNHAPSEPLRLNEGASALELLGVFLGQPHAAPAIYHYRKARGGRIMGSADVMYYRGLFRLPDLVCQKRQRTLLYERGAIVAAERAADAVGQER